MEGNDSITRERAEAQRELRREERRRAVAGARALQTRDLEQAQERRAEEDRAQREGEGHQRRIQEQLDIAAQQAKIAARQAKMAEEREHEIYFATMATEHEAAVRALQATTSPTGPGSAPRDSQGGQHRADIPEGGPMMDPQRAKNPLPQQLAGDQG